MRRHKARSCRAPVFRTQLTAFAVHIADRALMPTERLKMSKQSTITVARSALHLICNTAFESHACLVVTLLLSWRMKCSHHTDYLPLSLDQAMYPRTRRDKAWWYMYFVMGVTRCINAMLDGR